MKSQPNRDYVSNDDIQTPPWLAALIVEHFKPHWDTLEPCRGAGNFAQAIDDFTGVPPLWAEIKEARDFFQWETRVRWIITNPPWSQIRPFLQQAMRLADDIVFLMTINHAWTKARLRDVRKAGFSIREIALVDTPKEFPPSGFQLGAVHFKRGRARSIKMTDLLKAL